MKTLVEGQLPVFLLNHHQLGLVVHQLFRHAAKVAQRFVMQLDELPGIQRLKRQAHIHQPRVRQHKHNKVHHCFHATNQHVTQLARVNLALHTRHLINHRLVISVLTGCNLFLQRADVTTNTALGGRQLTQFLLELAGNLDCTEPGKAGQQADQVSPVGVELFAADRVIQLAGSGCFILTQILAHAVARDAQLPADGPNGKSFAIVM